MKVIRQLAKDELAEQFRDNHDFHDFVKPWIYSHQYGFEISIDQNEYLNLLINSSPQNPQPENPQFYTLATVLAQIGDDPGFLKRSAQGRGLKGTRVHCYLDRFRSGATLKPCLIVDKTIAMGEEGIFYVADGMHSLVAYGLWAESEAETFQITLFLCSNDTFS
ncbi:MAG: hypothetical protein K8S97_14830 [Anaerolineae bacterium]|nr:hypothetical protein [Anaerolineae bacterium]